MYGVKRCLKPILANVVGRIFIHLLFFSFADVHRFCNAKAVV